MFCPQCGQSQNVSELKFCSRCGFPLAGVVQLMSSGGILPQSGVEETGVKELSPRQKGTRQGVMLMLLTMLVVPLMAIVTVNLRLLPELLIPLSAIILFVGGLLRIIYAKLFEDSGPRPELAGPSAPAYVPPYMAPPLAAKDRPQIEGQQSVPVSAWRRPRNTAELVTPPSVTENTTRLLDENPEAK